MADDCLFCRIVRKEIPAKLVAEDEHCVAFRDINPQAPVHVLVIPREHVPSLNQATDASMLGRLSLMAADIAKKEGVAESGYRTVVREVEQACGGVDVLVHVAGGVRGQSKRPVEEVSDDDWRAIQAVNVEGAFFASRAVTPGMKKKGNGRIVVIASRAGLGVSLTGIQSYATAKAAQLGLVRQLAHELGPHGITVNAVAPGFLRTSPDYERQWQSYGPEGQKAMIERVAMRRLGEPQDIAHAVMFLASPYASWITGQVLPVTGSPIS